MSLVTRVSTLQSSFSAGSSSLIIMYEQLELTEEIIFYSAAHKLRARMSRKRQNSTEFLSGFLTGCICKVVKMANAKPHRG